MFDNFEINLVGEYPDSDGKTFCEVLHEDYMPKDCINKFYTIYGHMSKGGCKALIDIKYEEKDYAYKLFNFLQNLLHK